MINIGTDTIEKIYLGTDEIQRVYSGTELIYGLDPDVVNYITATGETDVTFIDALNTLVVYLKINGVYLKIKAWWIFYGNTTKSQHNVINQLIYASTFYGSGIVNNTGFILNGVDSFAASGFTPSVDLTANNHGFTIISATNNPAPTDDTLEMGAYNSGSQVTAMILKANNITNYRVAHFNDTSIPAVDTVNEAKGIFTGEKVSSSFSKLYRNSALLTTGGGGGILPSVPVYIGCLNVNNSPYGFSAQRLLQAMIHEGLSDSEVGILHTGLDIFENTLGRKTW